MDTEDDMDTHICLRCRSTIVGLEEYIKHKKQECPALNKNPDIKPTTLPQTAITTSTGDSVESQNAASPDAADLRQDAFLTMLELQSKNSPAKATAPISPRSVPPENELNEFSKAELERNEETVLDDYVLATLSDHGESDDELNPPTGHTGGKWKPGQGPKRVFVSNSPEKWLPSSEQPDHDYDKREKNDASTIEPMEIDDMNYCKDCDKYLESKQAYNKHFNSYSHLKRVGWSSKENKKEEMASNEQITYNCDVCDRHLSSKFAFARHVISPLHLSRMKTNKRDELAPLRKSSRRVVKNKLLNDAMWTLNEEEVENRNSDDEENDSSTLISCDPCKRTFRSKRNFAQHLLTTFHIKRTENHPERHDMLFKHLDLLTKLAPFQCGICSYYFNNPDYFFDHWKSDVHTENVASMAGPFLCVECDCVCKSNDEMLEHLQGEEHTILISTLDRKHPIIIKEKRGELFCKWCNLKFSTPAGMKKHEESAQHKKLLNSQSEVNQSENEETEFKCNSCSEEFMDEESLQEHELTHEDEVEEKRIKDVGSEKVKKVKLSSATCPDCDQVVATGIFGELSEHSCSKLQEVANDEGENVKYACSKCHYLCSSSTQLVYHQALHEKPKTCKSDTEETKEQNGSADDEVSTNKRAKSGRSVKKYKCTYCSKFYPKNALLAHLHTHTGEKPYKCNICTLAFAQKGTLYMHLKRHTGVKQFKCDQCSFAAEKPSRLKRHKEIHNVNRPRAHLCDVCGAGYHDRWSLKHHMKVHFGKDHKCPVEGCPQAFRCPSELQLHLRVHNDERPFLCDKCGYRGRSQHQLTKHRRSHTGERPFKCQYCSYSAHLSPHLMRHMRIHTGAKPYKCPYCDYTCNTQENVRKHILKTKKHEGKKMYPCRFCDYTTNSAVEYKAHILENHKDRVSTQDTDVVSFLAGVYDRNDNAKTTDDPIPYVPRQERLKNNAGKPKKKQQRKTKPPTSEPSTIYAIQLAGNSFDVDAEHILQTIEGNSGEQIYLPIEQEICTQGEEQTIGIPAVEETVITSELPRNLIENEGNTIYILYHESC